MSSEPDLHGPGRVGARRTRVSHPAHGDQGAAASAWTRDVFRAQTASRSRIAGTVWINDHIPIVSEMPHGGMKGSGYGKDMPAYSFDEYTRIKHVMSDITGAAAKPWHNTIYRQS